MNQDQNSGIFEDQNSNDNTNLDNSSSNQNQNQVSVEEYKAAVEKNKVFEAEMTKTRQELAELKRQFTPQNNVPGIQNTVDPTLLDAKNKLKGVGVVDMETMNTAIGSMYVNLQAREFAKSISSNTDDDRLKITGDELYKVMLEHNLFNDPEKAYRIARGDVKENIMAEKLAKLNAEFDKGKKNLNTAQTVTDPTIHNEQVIKEEDFTIENSGDNVLKELEAAGI